MKIYSKAYTRHNLHDEHNNMIMINAFVVYNIDQKMKQAAGVASEIINVYILCRVGSSIISHPVAVVCVVLWYFRGHRTQDTRYRIHSLK